MKDESHNIPFQVESLIVNLLNKTERQHVRENYCMRLESIRDAIDSSIKTYKNENLMYQTKRKRA
jgi:hypothetical protein